MYTLDSVNNQKNINTTVKTFPNLSAIEQMNRYNYKSNDKDKVSSKNTSDFDATILILMMLLLSKEHQNTDPSILPILFSLLI